jgi:hypothetical protein
MHLIRRVVFVILLATIAFLGLVRPHILVLTTTGQDRELVDVRLPGIDIGIDIIPAKAGQAGYLEAWWFLHDADDITILFAIPGAPALPVPPTDTIEV